MVLIATTPTPKRVVIPGVPLRGLGYIVLRPIVQYKCVVLLFSLSALQPVHGSLPHILLLLFPQVGLVLIPHLPTAELVLPNPHQWISLLHALPVGYPRQRVEISHLIIIFCLEGYNVEKNRLLLKVKSFTNSKDLLSSKWPHHPSPS